MKGTNPTPTQQGETLDRCPFCKAVAAPDIPSHVGWFIIQHEKDCYLAKWLPAGAWQQIHISDASRWNTRAAVAGPRGDTECRALGYVYEQPAALQWCVTHNRIMGECALAATESAMPQCGDARPDDGSECAHGFCPRPRDGCSEYCVDHHESLCAPPESTRVAGEWGNESAQARMERLAAQLEGTLNCLAASQKEVEHLRTATSDSARRAAEEIVQRVYGGGKDEFGELEMLVAGIISKHFAAAAPADNDAESLLREITFVADIGSAEEFGDALARLKTIRALIDATTKGDR